MPDLPAASAPANQPEELARDWQALRAIARVPEENPNPILRLSLAGERRYANAAALRLQSQLPEAAYAALFAELQAATASTLAAGVRQRVEVEVAAATKWFQVDVVPLAEEGYVNLYLLDVTALHQAQAELVAQRAFYETILHSLPAEVAVVGADRRYQYLNPATLADPALRQAALGRTVAELGADLGRPAEVMARRLARFEQAATGQDVAWTETVDKPAGRRQYLRRLHPVPSPDGAAPWFIAYGLDVTEQEQTQQALVRNEKQYRDLMHYAQAFICTYDLAGTVITVNPALANLLGQAMDELVGRPVAAFLLPEDQASFGRYLAHIAGAGEAEGVLRVQPRGRTDVRHLLYHNFVVREPGQAPYIISHSHDITARVEAEQALRLARDEAEATATARQNFLANMSHEIRTPMNGVLGMADQLATTRLDARQQRLIGLMQRSGQHLLAVLNDVLDMAKISAGKLEMEQVAFNLCDSMGAAVQPLAAQAAAKGLAFTGVPLRTSCPYPWVIGDAHRLNQILINLVSNAVKFTEQGTIDVVGELVDETADELTVRFRVSDTGPGIPAAQQARIFESFTQAQAGTARQFGGTGLGLSISRALVAQLGGTLTLASEEGRGSTFAFTVTLPRAAAPAPAAAAPAAYDTGRLAGVRVLVIEDNDVNRTLVEMMAEPWGVQLDQAATGPAGLARLAAHRYDVVLMDVQMPGLSGVDVTQRLRQMGDPARAATPVIAFTANVFREDIEGYLAAGMNAYLPKPIGQEALYRKLVEVLDAGPTPLYDLSLLKRQAQGRSAFVVQILRSVLANMPRSLAQLRAAAAAGQWLEAAEVAHHIRPNLLALGVAAVAPSLDVLARAHRSATSPAPSPKVLAGAVGNLSTVVERVLAALPAELEALLATMPPA
ncbi:ATP-binding protein [Hymenobacter sp. DH14]|uniref:histidine kinase n=1 Tax=Hymenobacter cyanobacteriorum TaxID=2926463 RepID=A0A9X2AH12_9BACT|nr:ATP-binding protein [Hymenobacter cyanobacteriorum]MCI1186925.1 ATP-binding protein [Hymenobacter cyanobacteriorum]